VWQDPSAFLAEKQKTLLVNPVNPVKWSFEAQAEASRRRLNPV